MLQFSRIEQAVSATGKVNSDELETLKKHIYANGPISRHKADFLVELHKLIRNVTPAFEQFFYQAIKDHLLADGWIDGQNVVWLRRLLSPENSFNDDERKLLHDLKSEAKKVSREFDLLFAASVKAARNHPRLTQRREH